jgi:hypothetical protein
MVLSFGTNADAPKSNFGSIQHPFLESYKKQQLGRMLKKPASRACSSGLSGLFGLSGSSG